MLLLYFASVREAIGRDSETVDPGAAQTIRELMDRLSVDEPYRTAFANPARLRAALDQRFAPLDAPIAGGRELAIFPPVTGG